MIKNKTLSNIEYKTISQEELLKLFQPLINNLGKAYGENRFEEDVKQSVSLELLKRQDLYDPTIGLPFPYYTHMYMKAIAKQTRQKNIAAIYIPYTSMIYLKKRNKLDDKHVISIDDNINEDQTKHILNNNSVLITIDEYPDEQPNKKYSQLKQIMKLLDKTDQFDDSKKDTIKKYIHDYLSDNTKLNKKLNNDIRKLLTEN